MVGVDELAGLSPLIRSAGIPFVIDHLSRCDPRRGIQDEAFILICDLVREGHPFMSTTSSFTRGFTRPVDSPMPIVMARP